MSVHDNNSHNKPTKRIVEDDAGKLDRFKTELADDANAMQDQREEAMLDLRFIKVKGGMWEDRTTLIHDDHFTDAADDSGLRVKLELDLISDHIDTFLGEYSLSRINVEYKPTDPGTTTDHSDLLNGIYRDDFRRNDGKIATDNAVQEAVIMGYGAVKLATAFEDEEVAENDNMNIVFRPIYNAPDTVFWDKSAQYIDKRDAGYCNVLQQHTKKSFERTYPGKVASSAYEPNDFRGTSNSSSRFSTGFSQEDIIWVSTRYEVVKVREERFVYRNLATGTGMSYTEDEHEKIKDELAVDEFKEFVRKRKVVRRVIEMTVFSGDDILRATRRIAGKHIPIVPFYAHRSYVDGQEQYMGMVRKLVDGQRVFNSQASQLLETSMSSGQEIPIFTEEQIEGDDLQEMWANRNNASYLMINTVRDENGDIIGAPISYLKAPQLDGATQALLAVIPNYMEAAKGEVPKEAFSRDMSGKAINALVKRINMKTQPINDNIASAYARIGEVYQGMASEIYTTSRIVNTISKEGTESTVQLLDDVMDEESGLVIQGNDLRGRKFQSFADVGPAYATLQEQSIEEMKGLLELLGNQAGGEEYVAAIIPILIENSPNVGLDMLKTLARNNSIKQGLLKPDSPDEEKMLEDFQAQQQEPDAQSKLIESAARKEDAEAQNLIKAGENKDQDTKLKAVESDKTQAETEKLHAQIAEIIDGLGDKRIATLMDHEHRTNQDALEREKLQRAQPGPPVR